MRASVLLVGLLLAPGAPARDAGSEEAAPFAFVVIADPHIAGKKDHEERLRDCVAWINASREARRIELVVVLGDIAWGKGQLARARGILDGIEVPYVPVIGDNEIVARGERQFFEVFGPQYARLAKTLGGWRKAPTPVKLPGTERRAYLQNFSFDHRGVHFVGLDWVVRDGGETADLHDFPGGTWPWLQEDLKAAAKGVRERIVLLSHLPMHWNPLHEVFDRKEVAALERSLSVHAEYVYANLAGHYHLTWWNKMTRGGYEVFVTDATHDDRNTVRLVTVRKAEGRFTYAHDLIRVPRRAIARHPPDRER